MQNLSINDSLEKIKEYSSNIYKGQGANKIIAESVTEELKSIFDKLEQVLMVQETEHGRVSNQSKSIDFVIDKNLKYLIKNTNLFIDQTNEISLDTLSKIRDINKSLSDVVIENEEDYKFP